MIPVRLDIEGLYSYREKQTVEFDQLTAAGLFGIFGAVGSGKSSILEAILLALYGSTERLAATGERSSMLNLQSDQLLVNFEFRAGKNNGQHYLARYSAKRNRKDPEKIDTGEHIIYRLEQSQWQAGEQKADEILGMGKDHFKQTIIIPQGKFREFIDQKPLDRAEMMQQLFGLERFDLASKTSSLRKVAELEKTRLKALLDNLSEATPESLEEKTQESLQIKTDLESATKAYSQSETQLRQLEASRKSYLQLQDLLQVFAQLKQLQPEIERKRELHREFIAAKTHLRPIWDRLQEATKDLEKYRVSAVDCERFKETFEKEVHQLELDEENLRKKNEERPQREGRVRDLKRVIEIKDLEQKLEDANRKLETLKPEIDAQESQEKLNEAEISRMENHLETLPKTDPQELSELISAQESWKTLEERIGDLQKVRNQLGGEIQKVRANLDLVNANVPQGNASLESWLYSQKIKIKRLESEREAFLKTQGLQAHAPLLVDGEPCPLCGSAHHPRPLEAEENQQKITEKEQQITQEKEVLEQIHHLIQQQKVAEIHLENHQLNALEKEKEVANTRSQLQELLNSLAGRSIPQMETLVEKIRSLQSAGKVIDQLAKELQAQRRSWTMIRQELEQGEKAFQNLLTSQQSLLALTGSKKAELKEPDFCKLFFPKPTESILEAIQKVEKDIEDAYNQHRGILKHLQEKRGEQVKNLADLENFKKLSKESAAKISQFSQQFEALKVEFGFLDEARLLALFSNSLDAEKVDLEIRQFEQKLSTTQSRILELQAEEGVQQFSEAAFLSLADQLKIQKTQVEELQKHYLLLQESIKNLRQKLEEKQGLSRDFSKIENRESNLRELERLFQGKGFVKFVSSIYLRELCNTANQRFMKLTKNSLSLEIDDSNTFWVIDYLNGGKRRLLKTLSGGQTFQASLCLALALAEKVKALNQADQSFFFLDEGFGALDRNALRVVFETLKSLRHEKRVVGIISHVEELQQEIGVFAQVELDTDRGSVIRYSY